MKISLIVVFIDISLATSCHGLAASTVVPEDLAPFSDVSVRQSPSTTDSIQEDRRRNRKASSTLRFKEDLTLTVHVNASLADGWSHVTCCPEQVLECGHERVDVNWTVIGGKEGDANEDAIHRIWFLTPRDDEVASFSSFSSCSVVRKEEITGKSTHGGGMSMAPCRDAGSFRYNDGGGVAALKVQVYGKRIGTGQLRFYLVNGNSSTVPRPAMVRCTRDVMVLPPVKRFGVQPTIGMFVGFALNIFGFSLTVEKSDVVSFLRRPVELVIIACVQYLAYPLLAWCTNWLLAPPPIFRFALLCIASASAGDITNLCCVLTRARINLNVLSMMTTPLLGIVAVPIWVYTLGKTALEEEFPGHKIEFPWFLFLALKGLFLVPGLLFLCVKSWLPSRSRTISLVVRPVALVWVLCMMSLLAVDAVWTLDHAADWRVALGPVVLLSAGALLTFPLSYAITRSPKTSLTCTIQGIMANPSYAILFCLTMVPKPYTPVPLCTAILYLLSVISFSLLSALVCLLLRIFKSSQEGEEKPPDGVPAFKVEGGDGDDHKTNAPVSRPETDKRT